MKKYLLLSLFSIVLLFSTKGQNIVLQTGRASGLPAELEMRMISSGDIEIDWGSGSKMKYSLTTASANISGIISGEFIKIYGPKVNFINCEGLDLVSIDVSKATELLQLYCGKNDLTHLDVSCNTKLVRLGSSNSKLTELDLSKNPKITGLYLQNNLFDSNSLNKMFDDVPKHRVKSANVNFRIIGNPGAATSNTQVAIDKNWNMDMSGDNTGGKPIVLTTNKNVGDSFEINLRLVKAGRIEIDWGKGTVAVNVSTNSTKVIGKLEAGNTIKLFGDNINFIECLKQELTNIDVSSAKELQQIYVGSNNLSEIDVTNNQALTRLGINDNKIKTVDLSKNSRLSGLFFQNNDLDACALNAIYKQLPNRSSKPENVNFRVTGNPGAKTSNTQAADRKGWHIDTEGDNTGCK